MIALWLALERIQADLQRVYVWSYDAAHMQYWPGADLHPVPTFVLCLAGKLRVQKRAYAQKTENLDLAAGEALVIAPSVCHEHVVLRGDYTALQMGFLRQSSDYWLYSRNSRMLGRVPAEPYRQLMEGLLLCSVDERATQLSGLLQVFLDEQRHVQEGVPPALEAMQLYLQANAHLPISADDIVHASGLQHAQAYAIFCRYYEAPPFQVLQQRRVDIAQAHLRAGLGIQEVALCSGFTSTRNFTRAFQRVHGESVQSWMQRELA